MRFDHGKEFMYIPSRGGSRKRDEKRYPYRVLDEFGAVLATYPDEHSARKFARAVSGCGVATVERIQ